MQPKCNPINFSNNLFRTLTAIKDEAKKVKHDFKFHYDSLSVEAAFICENFFTQQQSGLEYIGVYDGIIKCINSLIFFYIASKTVENFFSTKAYVCINVFINLYVKKYTYRDNLIVYTN